MSLRSKQYIICYDICDEKRLSKIHRYLIKKAMPIQYSVFYAELTPSQVEQIVEDLIYLHHTQDDIRIYTVKNFKQSIFIGKTPNVTIL